MLHDIVHPCKIFLAQGCDKICYGRSSNIIKKTRNPLHANKNCREQMIHIFSCFFFFPNKIGLKSFLYLKVAYK